MPANKTRQERQCGKLAKPGYGIVVATHEGRVFTGEKAHARPMPKRHDDGEIGTIPPIARERDDL